MTTAADPGVSTDQYRSILCSKNWNISGEETGWKRRHSPSWLLLFLIPKLLLSFLNWFSNSMVYHHVPASPSLTNAPAVPHSLCFTQTRRLIQAAEPAKALTMSSHSCLCRPPAKTELQVRSLRAGRQGDASVNTYKLNAVCAMPTKHSPRAQSQLWRAGYSNRVSPKRNQLHLQSTGFLAYGESTVEAELDWVVLLHSSHEHGCASKFLGQMWPENTTDQLQSRGYGWSRSTPPGTDAQR